MKILVTGGAGFIGSHIVEFHQTRADEIRVLDNLRTGYRRNLDGLAHTFIEPSNSSAKPDHGATANRSGWHSRSKMKPFSL